MIGFVQHSDLQRIGVSNHARRIPERPALIAGEEARTLFSRADLKVIPLRELEGLMEGLPKDTPPPLGEVHEVPPSLTYTSGTTGRPKGVIRGARNRLNTLLGCAFTFESTYSGVHLVAGLLYHSAPLGWAAFSLLSGNTLVIMPRFDPEAFLRLGECHRVTTTFMVPTMINRTVHLPKQTQERYDISSLRVISAGGESFPFPLKEKAAAFFGEGKIFEFYGGTETSCVTYLRPEDQLRKPGSCGRPVMGSQIRLLDENLQDVRPGTPGSSLSRTPFFWTGMTRIPRPRPRGPTRVSLRWGTWPGWMKRATTTSWTGPWTWWLQGESTSILPRSRRCC